jgi:uncharacterized protein
MNLDYPFHIDARGRTGTTTDADHIRDMIEQILFTKRGERVNRPGFGCGLHMAVFGPNTIDDTVAVTSAAQIGSELHEWLGDLIVVQEVQVSCEDSTLYVAVSYQIRRTGQEQTASFETQRSDA